MMHGRDHQGREQRRTTRLAEQNRRDADDEGEGSTFTRQARAEHPAPTAEAHGEERARHASAGTVGGHVGAR
jgi:hypothetical protein